MLFGKRKKLVEYLAKQQADKALTTFDAILSDHLSGALKEKLGELAIQ